MLFKQNRPYINKQYESSQVKERIYLANALWSIAGTFSGGIAVGINKNTQNRKNILSLKKGNRRLDNILSNELYQTRTVLNSRQMQ